MGQGEDRKKHIFRDHLVNGAHVLCIAQDVFVGQHHPFGPSGGPGGIDDGGQVVGGGPGEFHPVTRRGGIHLKFHQGVPGMIPGQAGPLFDFSISSLLRGNRFRVRDLSACDLQQGEIIQPDGQFYH